MGFDRSILSRYREGKCSREEQILVESWFNKFTDDTPFEKEQFLKHLDSLDARFYQGETKNIYTLKIVFGLVAAVLISMTIGWYIFQYRSPSNVNKVLESYAGVQSLNSSIVLENNEELKLEEIIAGDTIHFQGWSITKLGSGEIKYILDSKPLAPVYHTMRTREGATANLRLADGSQVWLNANSELRYPVFFNAGSRDVYLEGEGYFEVEALEEREEAIPFIVHGQKHTITVLGTRFNANFNDSVIALLSGKVGVSKTEQFQVDAGKYLYTLHPNDVFMNDKVFRSPSITDYIDWQQGYFNLNNQTLSEFSAKIASWYAINIVVDQRIVDLPLFGRVSHDKNLKEVMELLVTVLPITYRYEKDKLLIVPKE